MTDITLKKKEITLNYTDAFDEIITSPDHTEEESLSDTSSMVSVDDVLEDFDVTFITDDEDDDSGVLVVKEDPKKILSHKEHLTKLNEYYKKQLDECGDMLQGKLNWKSSQPSPTSSSSENDLDHFPTLTAKPMTKREQKEAAMVSKPLFDPKPLPPLPSRRNNTAAGVGFNKKSWFCKNLIQTGTCRFGNRCIYAHSLDEVESNIHWCKYYTKCNNVSVSPVTNTYVNKGRYKCVRRHPNEAITNFVKRMQ